MRRWRSCFFLQLTVRVVLGMMMAVSLLAQSPEKKPNVLFIAVDDINDFSKGLSQWKCHIIQAETRKKMDNAYLGDLDGDGDLDVATTEENGAWGVIWFENPLNN